MTAWSAHPSGRLRVLLAEDSDDDARLITRTLERAFGPTEALTVPDLETFRVALEYGTWHVVISDHSNPRCRPDDMLAILEEDQLPVPFLLVSGSVDAALERGMRAAGAEACIGKHELERLVDVLARVLDRPAASRPGRGPRAARLRDPLALAALESLPLAAVLLDAGGRVLHANGAATRLLGASRRECRRHALRDWCVPVGAPERAPEVWAPAELRRPYRMPVPIQMRSEPLGADARGPRVVLLRQTGAPPRAEPGLRPMLLGVVRRLTDCADALSAWARLRRDCEADAEPHDDTLELVEATALVAARLLRQWRRLLRSAEGPLRPTPPARG
jgi:PAS domain-containing protein